MGTEITGALDTRGHYCQGISIEEVCPPIMGHRMEGFLFGELIGHDTGTLPTLQENLNQVCNI
jgi:hypothetical protein